MVVAAGRLDNVAEVAVGVADCVDAVPAPFGAGCDVGADDFNRSPTYDVTPFQRRRRLPTYDVTRPKRRRRLPTYDVNPAPNAADGPRPMTSTPTRRRRRLPTDNVPRPPDESASAPLEETTRNRPPERPKADPTPTRRAARINLFKPLTL